jgi:uncharacterized protein with PhoU and TrkA domain
MTTNNNYAENKTIEEIAHDIRVAVGKGAEKAGNTAKAFSKGVKKGIEKNKSIEEKAEDAGEAVVKGVKDGADKIKKGIDKEKDKIERAQRG